MSVQEIRQHIHNLVDETDDEIRLEKLLNSANEILADSESQHATLDELTDDQRTRLDKATQQHREGKTVSNETMKQRYRTWLTD